MIEKLRVWMQHYAEDGGLVSPNCSCDVDNPKPHWEYKLWVGAHDTGWYDGEGLSDQGKAGAIDRTHDICHLAGELKIDRALREVE